MKTSSWFALSLACVLTACTSTYARDQLRTQAVFDLRCPTEQLVFTDLGGLTIPLNGMRTVQGVTGCGKSASYVYAPHSGAWVKNGTETTPAASAPPH